MDSNFNPYREWLGIEERELPANYYRLLGLRPFETTPAVIAGGADRMIGYVRNLQPGQYDSQRQRLLDELTSARLCLLDPERKAHYDVELRSDPRLANAPVPAAAPAPAAWSQAGPPLAQPASTPHGYPQPAGYGQPAGYAPPAGYPQSTGYAQPTGYPQPNGYAPPSYAPQPYPYPSAPQQPAGYYAAPVARPLGGPAPQPTYGDPMAPVGVPLGAVGNGEPAVALAAAPISSGVSVADGRASTVTRRRKRSDPTVMILLGLGAGALLLAGVVAAVQSGKDPSQKTVVAANSPSRVSPAARSERTPTKPASTQPAPRKPSTTVETSSQEAMPIPGLKYGNEGESVDFNSPEIKIVVPPQIDPATGDPPQMEATAPAVVPDPPVVVVAPPMPAATAEPTPEQRKAFDKALRTAYESLGRRDLKAARAELNEAKTSAISKEQQDKLAGMELVHQGVDSFWAAVRDGLKGLIGTSEELELNSTRVAIVEAGPDFLVLRAAGQNRRYDLDNMPAGLAMVLAKRWFDASASSTHVFIGSFLFVDARGDKAEVRRLWEQAGAAGVKIDTLLPLLELKQ